MIRTRFAPSPTGFLHIGGLRTALFSWAYARKLGGRFILRIEDTDLERSTSAAVAAILEGMHWAGLEIDEGPFYQTQRFDRYAEVIKMMLASGQAYYCYCSKEELGALRATQEARGDKPRYDRRWRPEPGKVLPAVPAGVKPVVRFKNPLTGVLAWNDAVKGRIAIDNNELDDLIIARADGSPTYNFCVVVDDWDMQITHVIRGDDHVNNTPRQINILQSLGAAIPIYAHLPMILNAQGQKMSKRRDAVSVMDYAQRGILSAALLNYLARLGWGHGDDEFFSLEQFVQWFDLAQVSPAAARFDEEKLLWLNAQHIKAIEPAQLALCLAPLFVQQNLSLEGGPALEDVLRLTRDRAQDLNALVQECDYFYRPRLISEQEIETYLSAEVCARLARFAQRLAAVAQWDATAISTLLKSFCTEEGIKMVELGIPLRVLVCGTRHTPSIDKVLALIGREAVLSRINLRLPFKGQGSEDRGQKRDSR